MVLNSVNALKLKTLAYSRLALYTAESLPIIFTRRLLSKKTGNTSELSPDRNKELHIEFKQLVEEDVSNIAAGLYSVELLKPESIKQHAKRYAFIWYDSALSALRKNRNRNKEFSSEAKDFFEGLPEYYKRNFHFQTNGYLSHQSAEIYSHQTEILFHGTLALMRRVLVAEIIKEFIDKNQTVRVLELGSGAGELTEILMSSSADIQITCLDLSPPYMEQAKTRLTNVSKINFVQGNAEDFNDLEKYDLILSSYMFHELPDYVRSQVVKNSIKMLSPDGTMVILDSLQWNDSPQFNWALEQFPKDFHEPFFKNYIKTPLSDYFKEKFKSIETKHSFLSKIVIAKGLNQ